MPTPHSASPRGFTLVELIVSQVIVAIIAAGIFSLIAAQTKSFHSTWSVTEAQVRLRESTHLLLRDVQGLGDVGDGAGELVGFIDGGGSAADSLMAYRTDIALCTGGWGAVPPSGAVDTVELPVGDTDGDPVTPDACPIGSIPGCSVAELVGRTALLHGAQRDGYFLITAADTSTCTVTFGNGPNADHLLNYAAIQRVPTPGAVAAIINPGASASQRLGAITSLSFGTSTRFFVDAATDTLRRVINAQPAEVVVDGIYDLQVASAHDLNADNEISSGEWDQSTSLTGANPGNFMAMRIGLMSFASSKQNIEAPPPTVFGNRNHTAAPTGRRYRQSYVIAAARNR